MAKAMDLRRAEVDEQIADAVGAGCIIGIDPSSSAIGLAAMSRSGHLFAYAVVKAKGTLGMVARIEGMTAEMLAWWMGVKRGTEAMAAENVVAVIELPDGMNKAGGKGQQGAAVYGAAAGWVACTVQNLWSSQIVTPSPRMWNGGRGKEATQRMVALEYPEYDPEKDKGMDASDAIAIARWAVDRIRIKAGEV